MESAYPDNISDSVQHIEDDLDLEVEIAGDAQNQSDDHELKVDDEEEKKQNPADFYEDSPHGARSHSIGSVGLQEAINKLGGDVPESVDGNQDEGALVVNDALADNAGFLTVSNLQPAIQAANSNINNNDLSGEADSTNLNYQSSATANENTRKSSSDMDQFVSRLHQRFRDSTNKRKSSNLTGGSDVNDIVAGLD